MSVQVAIVCNRCGKVADADYGADHKPAHVMRSQSKGRGWAVGCYSLKDRSSSGSMDFCPACVAAFIRERAAS